MPDSIAHAFLFLTVAKRPTKILQTTVVSAYVQRHTVIVWALHIHPLRRVGYPILWGQICLLHFWARHTYSESCTVQTVLPAMRSEERRVGNECCMRDRQCRVILN